MRKYRHEIKYTLNNNQAKILNGRLKKLCNLDKFAHNKDGSYEIKSLYFDDIDNSALHEKIDGVLYRKKYRIRIYNNSEDRIILEAKYKHNNLTSKDSVLITKEIYSKIISGNIDDIDYSNSNLLAQFILDMKIKLLRPSVIVKYNRIAYTYPVSDVRITLDKEISNEGFNYDLFKPNAPTYKISLNKEVVLEVKYNDVLPRIIADIISTVPINREAVSKFQRNKSIQ